MSVPGGYTGCGGCSLADPSSWPIATGALSTGFPSGPPPTRRPARLDAAQGAPPLTPRKKRAPKPPKDSRVRKAVVATIALRAQGFTYREAAEHLGLTRSTVHTYMQKARKEGWISDQVFADPSDRLEHVLQSAVVQNLEMVLKETRADAELDTALSDRALDITKEVAKGTGLFKQHQVVKGEGGAQVGFALKVDVVMPAAGTVPTVRPGSTGGTPYFDAEVVEEN